MSTVNIGNATIVIGILARDCINGLKNNITRVESLGRMFKDYHVIVYENDSKDGTKECVLQWAKDNSNVIAISEEFNQLTIPKKSKHVSKPTKSEWRIQKMAVFRNRILEEVNKRFSPDYFCFIDIDIESFAPSSIVEAIEKAPEDWGALCASGHLYYSTPDGNDYPANFQYDAYAFFPEGYFPERKGKRAISHKWHLMSAWSAEKLVRQNDFSSCRSAFNGLAVYKWNIVKNLHYSAVQNKDLKNCNSALCEHLSLHHAILSQGYKIYITRIIEVVYLHKRATIPRRFNNKYNVLLAKLYLSIYSKDWSPRKIINHFQRSNPLKVLIKDKNVKKIYKGRKLPKKWVNKLARAKTSFELSQK